MKRNNFSCHPGKCASIYPGPRNTQRSAKTWVPDISAARKFRDDKYSIILHFNRMNDHNYYVYILASQRNGTLYTGVTNDLVRRVWEHKNGYTKGFAHKYGVNTLVWFEHHEDVDEAIAREKRIKRWRRSWKLSLIEKSNPHWRDLFDQLSV